MKGQLAPVYLQFANSQPSLRAYLSMEKCLQQGSLHPKEIEAVKLWVSEHTDCRFCLSVHSFKATNAGLSAEQQTAIRRGRSCGDSRIDCLVELAVQLIDKPGVVPDDMLARARSNGLSDENLVDLTMVISTILFTNITNHINDTALSLPPAPKLD